MGRIAEFAGSSATSTPPINATPRDAGRLSFATAVCFQADTYVFDEVLSVVDDSFRDKSADELARLNAGATVIFMSHDLELVKSVCSTGMWLENGQLGCAAKSPRSQARTGAWLRRARVDLPSGGMAT